MVYPYSGIVSRHRKEQGTDACYDVDELENMLRERARHKRSYIIQFRLYEISRIVKFIETESRLVVGSGWGKGGLGEWPLNGDRVSFGGDENALELGRGDGHTTPCVC